LKFTAFGFAAKYDQCETTKQLESHCDKAGEFLIRRAKDRFVCEVWALGVTFLLGTRSALLKEMLTGLVFHAEVLQDLSKMITKILSLDGRMRPTMAQLLENPTFTVVKSTSLIKFNSFKPLNFAFQRPFPVGMRKAISNANGIMPICRKRLERKVSEERDLKKANQMKIGNVIWSLKKH
jgi:serine/threonine protein kinase